MQRAFALISSSRYGIAEDELVQLLDVPLDEWSALLPLTPYPYPYPYPYSYPYSYPYPYPYPEPSGPLIPSRP